MMDSTFHSDIYDEQKLKCMMSVEFYFIIHSGYSCVIKLSYEVHSTGWISKFKMVANHYSFPSLLKNHPPKNKNNVFFKCHLQQNMNIYNHRLQQMRKSYQIQ